MEIECTIIIWDDIEDTIQQFITCDFKSTKDRPFLWYLRDNHSMSISMCVYVLIR